MFLLSGCEAEGGRGWQRHLPINERSWIFRLQPVPDERAGASVDRNEVIGGAMCSSSSAFWVPVDGHPQVQVIAPAVAEVSVSFLGAGGAPLGSDQAGQISVGQTGVALVGSVVTASVVRAVSVAVAGSTIGTCVAPEVG